VQLIDYDPNAQVFTNFLVVINGEQFDLTSAANNPTIQFTDPCSSGLTGAAAAFSLLNGCAAPYVLWIADLPFSQGIDLFEFFAEDNSDDIVDFQATNVDNNDGPDENHYQGAFTIAASPAASKTAPQKVINPPAVRTHVP